jgi:hypothetical protein
MRDNKKGDLPLKKSHSMEDRSDRKTVAPAKTSVLRETSPARVISQPISVETPPSAVVAEATVELSQTTVVTIIDEKEPILEEKVATEEPTPKVVEETPTKQEPTEVPLSPTLPPIPAPVPDSEGSETLQSKDQIKEAEESSQTSPVVSEMQFELALESKLQQLEGCLASKLQQDELESVIEKHLSPEVDLPVSVPENQQDETNSRKPFHKTKKRHQHQPRGSKKQARKGKGKSTESSPLGSRNSSETDMKALEEAALASAVENTVATFVSDGSSNNNWNGEHQDGEKKEGEDCAVRVDEEEEGEKRKEEGEEEEEEEGKVEGYRRELDHSDTLATLRRSAELRAEAYDSEDEEASSPEEQEADSSCFEAEDLFLNSFSEGKLSLQTLTQAAKVYIPPVYFEPMLQFNFVVYLLFFFFVCLVTCRSAY